jgi:hypothetical protein
VKDFRLSVVVDVCYDAIKMLLELPYGGRVRYIHLLWERYTGKLSVRHKLGFWDVAGLYPIVMGRE